MRQAVNSATECRHTQAVRLQNTWPSRKIRDRSGDSHVRWRGVQDTSVNRLDISPQNSIGDEGLRPLVHTDGRRKHGSQIAWNIEGVRPALVLPVLPLCPLKKRKTK